jgi:hypothetical protein
MRRAASAVAVGFLALTVLAGAAGHRSFPDTAPNDPDYDRWESGVDSSSLSGVYDLNGDGVFNIQDYAADRRFRDVNGTTTRHSTECRAHSTECWANPSP